MKVGFFYYDRLWRRPVVCVDKKVGGYDAEIKLVHRYEYEDEKCLKLTDRDCIKRFVEMKDDE